LRDHLVTILNASTLTGMDSEVQRSVELAEQILNGMDLNENTEVEPIVDECGALVTYEYTYHMADMSLLPVNPLDTPTPLGGTAVTPIATLATPITRTPTARPGDTVATVPAAQPTIQPTDRIPPGQATNQARPTREPKPTNDNNGGGNGGSGGGNDGGNNGGGGGNGGNNNGGGNGNP
jgi:hypothetical protein